MPKAPVIPLSASQSHYITSKPVIINSTDVVSVAGRSRRREDAVVGERVVEMRQSAVRVCFASCQPTIIGE